MADNDKDLPIVNFEKLSTAFSFYKFPLILASIGIILAVISIIILLKPQTDESGIMFSTEATRSAKLTISIDVEGSVVKPGVYQFDDGDRVEDAIEAAGGLTEQADLVWIEKNMNRAAKLTDGGKIYIAKKGEPGVAEVLVGKQENTLGVTTGLININSASQSVLESLPGVGPVTAGKIIDGRPYQSVEELKSKKAIGNSLYDKIKDKLTI